MSSSSYAVFQINSIIFWCCRQWLEPKGINPLCINFTKQETTDEPENLWRHERKFATQADPLFRHYLVCAFVICSAIVSIKLIVPKMVISGRLQWATIGTVAIIVASLLCTYSRPEKLSYGFRIVIWIIVSISLILISTVDIVAENCMKDKKLDKLSNCSYSWVSTHLSVNINNRCSFLAVLHFLYDFINDECNHVHSNQFMVEICNACKFTHSLRITLEKYLFGADCSRS